MTMNKNPIEARKARRKKAKKGTLEDVGRKVYAALERCEMLLEDMDPAIQLKAAHGVFQGASAYAKLLEVGELDARLQAFEAAQSVDRV